MPPLKLTPVQAALEFAAGNVSAFGDIPVVAGRGRAALRDMDGLPIVPSRAWCGYHTGVWITAGLLEINADTSRFRLTPRGRAILAGGA